MRKETTTKISYFNIIEFWSKILIWLNFLLRIFSPDWEINSFIFGHRLDFWRWWAGELGQAFILALPSKFGHCWPGVSKHWPSDRQRNFRFYSLHWHCKFLVLFAYGPNFVFHPLADILSWRQLKFIYHVICFLSCNLLFRISFMYCESNSW